MWKFTYNDRQQKPSDGKSSQSAIYIIFFNISAFSKVSIFSSYIMDKQSDLLLTLLYL